MAPTILTGFDGGERGHDAIALARRLAEATSARLLVAHGYHYDAFPTPPTVADTDVLLREAAARTLEDVRGPLAGFSRWETRTGGGSSPAAVLHRIAEDEQVDLIVVGSTHRSGLGRILPGSTGVRLLHGAPCAVAVAPAGYAARPDAWLTTIGAAYDATAEAAAGVRSAAGLAQSAGSALRVISVVDLPPADDPIYHGAGRQQLLDAAHEARRHALDDLLLAVDPKVPTESALLEGEVGQVLERESEGLDLLVTGSRGYGPLRRVLLGTVSGAILRSSHCPVLVVPRGVQRPFGTPAPTADGSA